MRRLLVVLVGLTACGEGVARLGPDAGSSTAGSVAGATAAGSTAAGGTSGAASTSTAAGSTSTSAAATTAAGTTASAAASTSGGAGTTSTSAVAAGSTSSATSTAAASSTGGATTSSSSSGTTTGSACGAGCGANARCLSGVCTCDPGFTDSGSGCQPVPPGGPTAHSQAEVCQAWHDGHAELAATPFIPGASVCDPGTLPQDAIADALRRINMFRWLAGLGPVTDDPGQDVNDQACAVISANNPAGPQAHHPDPSSACYSSEGAAGAGSSNIAWGCYSAAGAMDQWMEDWGNDTTMGHRRWILHPSLGAVGLGFYSGGAGPYGAASCLGVFGGGNAGPFPDWYAWPPPGFAPSGAAYRAWTVHSPSLGVGGATITVTRLSDGADVPVTLQPLNYGYGDDAVMWYRTDGASWPSNETYRVSVGGISAPFTYDVQLVDCP